MSTLENKEQETVEIVQQEVTENAPQQEEQSQQPAEASAAPTTRESIFAKLKELLASNEDVEEIKEEAEALKNQFYRAYRQEKAAIQEQIEEAKEDYQPVVDELEKNFRELLGVYKQRRAEAAAKREAEQQQNQLRKENIIEQLKTFVENETADVLAHLPQVKELQAEWKTIGKVPATLETSINKLYTQYLDRFYDLVQIHHDLRDYDFKKNLEQKTALCEQAEALKEKENVVEAFQALQVLHDEWKNIGPVAREVREAIWERFKAASTVINKRHQDFFTALHSQEEANQQKKEGLLEQLQAIDFSTLTNNKLWDEATELVQKIQAEWRTIGFAPKKFNAALYEEYRRLCDAFFAAKTAFYQNLRADLNANLEKKRELVRKAEALKDSTDWKGTTDKLVKLQAEWKTIGPVGRKQSEEVWKQFSAACDYFFERKKAATQGQREAEKENLAQKRAVIAEIEALEITTKNETLDKLHELIVKYNAIGFVPFKEKDKLQKQFRAATDRIFEALQIEAHNRRIDAFSKSVEGKDENALLNDRRRLVRQYEALEAEIKTAENNILFFSGNSKKGNKLVEDMERKIQQQKKQLAEIYERIKLIDSKLD